MPRKGKGQKRLLSSDEEEAGEDEESLEPQHKRANPAPEMELDESSVAQEVLGLGEDLGKIFPMDVMSIPEVEERYGHIQNGNVLFEVIKSSLDHKQQMSEGVNQHLYSQLMAPDSMQPLLQELCRSQTRTSQLQRSSTEVRKTKMENLNPVAAFMLRTGRFEMQARACPDLEVSEENPAYNIKLAVTKKKPPLDAENLPQLIEEALDGWNEQHPEHHITVSDQMVEELTGNLLEAQSKGTRTLLRPEIKAAPVGGGRNGKKGSSGLAEESRGFRAMAAALGRLV